MKFPLYHEKMEWDRAVDNIVHSLEHDYDAANERISYVFDEVQLDNGMFTMKWAEEYIGVVFYQYEVATGKKYKFTITREAA
jgi:hypothetical protein